jgi:hypothetical protein
MTGFEILVGQPRLFALLQHVGLCMLEYVFMCVGPRGRPAVSFISVK